MAKQTTQTIAAINSDIQAFANVIVQTLDGLAQKRENWERTDFKKANDGLYAILAECLTVFQAEFVRGTDDQRKALRGQLTSKLKAAGVKVQTNTTTINMFVRFVFGSDRKRAHGYAYVLQAAISHEIKAQDLPDWIRESGGIEEIKRKMVRSEEALLKQQEIDAQKAAVQADVANAEVMPLARVNVGALSGDYAVVLVKPNPDGSASVLECLSDVGEAMFNDIIKRIAKARYEGKAVTRNLNNEVDMLKKNAA
jgi:hypothetical protein